MIARESRRSCSKPDVHQSAASRLLGVYPQKQNGLFMQRVKVFGGRINWPQWRRIAQLSEDYCSGFPLHITTRQDIELHNIAVEDIAAGHQGLAEVALAMFGACGDSVRNVTVCAGCDLSRDGLDLLPLAQLVRQELETKPVVFNLPRKFKMSFSGCEKACARPWLNDMGFIAQDDGRFVVVGAGSLGARPALGIELYGDLPAKDVLPLCVAAVEFFEQYGDRGNRRRARFRHVRERLGDDAFRAELDGRFSKLKSGRTWPDILPAASSKNVELLYRLQLPNGNISPREAVELADIAEPKGAVLRVNLEHGLELYGTETVQLPENLAALANNPTIVACPGSTTCPRGLADCWATADGIREALASRRFPDVRINISGCPNNCGQSAVADIGLVGMLRKENGHSVAHYRVLAGGGNGKNDSLAEERCIVRDSDVSSTIESLLK